MSQRNTISQLRIEMGLTRPKMLELIGAKPGRLALLSMPDDQIAPYFITRARLLRTLYSEWTDEVYATLSRYETTGIVALTSAELRDLIGLHDMHIAQNRKREKIETIRVGHEYRYTLESLRRLIASNSTALLDPGMKRGPLAFGFLHWLGRREAGGIDITSPGRVGRTVMMNDDYTGQPGERALVLV